MNPLEWASTKGPEIHLGLEAWERGKRFPQKENIIDLVLIPGLYNHIGISVVHLPWMDGFKKQRLNVLP